MSQKWDGKSQGSVLGYKIFIFLLRYTHLSVAYFILFFVAFYYFAFAASKKYVMYYFQIILGYSYLRAQWAAYRNYYVFGQTLIDKFAALSGLGNKYEVVHEGMENLDKLAELKGGAILVSAHIGNWELAGNKLNRLKTKFNVLMYDNEREAMKEFAAKKMSEKKINIIPIDMEGMSHMISLHKAFSEGEILVMHSDRYVEGAAVAEMDFMGKKADFPTGPFYLAAKFGVPVCFVYAVKTGFSRYQLFAFEPIPVARIRDEEQVKIKIKELMEKNVKSIEFMVKRFPLQWFNYYRFWKN